MPRFVASLLFSSVALATVSPAAAATFVYTGTFSGSAEVPANASPGIGTIVATYDDVLQSLRIQTTFARLLGNTTMAHIHCCAPVGSNAGVATTLPTLPGFPLGVTFGSSDTTLDLASALSFNPAFVVANGNSIATARAALVNGFNSNLTYFNIHTTLFPAGEIRAQLLAVNSAVPEPASWGMMLLGMGLAGHALRTRRQRVTYA